MIRLAISGALGRMGRVLIEATGLHKEVVVGAALEQAGKAEIGSSVQALTGLNCTAILSDSLRGDDFDVLIEFSNVEATLKHLEQCVALDKAIVIGTTGFNSDQTRIIQQAAQHIPVVFASNMSIGVQVSLALLAQAAILLKDKGYDIEIVEAHHRHKTDAPSGTALTMGSVITEALGWSGQNNAVFCREGQTGARPDQVIGYQSVRAGDIVGDHTVLFATEGERIEISHKASSRMTFAKGAVEAACWLSQKQAGLYTMQDVMGVGPLD